MQEGQKSITEPLFHMQDFDKDAFEFMKRPSAETVKSLGKQDTE